MNLSEALRKDLSFSLITPRDKYAFFSKVSLQEALFRISEHYLDRYGWYIRETMTVDYRETKFPIIYLVSASDRLDEIQLRFMEVSK